MAACENQLSCLVSLAFARMQEQIAEMIEIAQPSEDLPHISSDNLADELSFDALYAKARRDLVSESPRCAMRIARHVSLQNWEVILHFRSSVTYLNGSSSYSRFQPEKPSVYGEGMIYHPKMKNGS